MQLRALTLPLVISVLCISARNDSLPSCLDASIRNAPCSQQDTLCGTWEHRSYIPVGCTYRSFTTEQATKCLSNRTIACIGDSLMRDMCNGLGMLLQGYNVNQAPDTKFDKIASPFAYAAGVGSFKSWKLNRDQYNALLYPKDGTANATWQVQGWILRNHEFLADNHLEDILSGKLIAEEPMLHNVSIAFWSYGLHEQELWRIPPFGQQYYDHFVTKWLKVRNEVNVPLIWTAINEHCAAHDPTKKIMPGHFKLQSEMTRAANIYTRTKLREMKLPYYDFAAPLRTPQICQVSSDGVHVKMWVDLVRAQILLNHLCDENYNWVGSADAFK
jgi:hypothetical protein